MSRVDSPFREFRLWWRAASNPGRSRALVTGTAAVAFFVWIAVPSGGALLSNFAGGYPGGAAGTRPGGAEASSMAPGSNPLGLGASSLLSSGDLGAGLLGTGTGVPGGGGNAPRSTGSPTTSGGCPVSFPPTNTPLDGAEAELSALCQELVGSGLVPGGSLPGGGSAAGAGRPSAVPGGGAPVAPAQWMSVDTPLGASGSPGGGWSPELTSEITGGAPGVSVALVEGSAISGDLARTLGDLERAGAVVELLLVPQPANAGGPPAFASWASRALGVLGTVRLVAVAAGGTPDGSTPSTLAAFVAAALGEVRAAPGRPAAGVSWLDGGATNQDLAVWSALTAAGVWSSTSFVASEFDAAASCTTPPRFASAVRSFPAAAPLPLVYQAVPVGSPAGGSPAGGSAAAGSPAGGVAAEVGCVRASLGDDPAASVARWRVGEGPGLRR